MGFTTDYLITSGPPGLPPFGTPMKDLMSTQIERGVFAPLPLVVDLTVQYLRQRDLEGVSFTNSSLMHDTPDEEAKIVMERAEFLVAALERDRHEGILLVWGCQQPQVVATVLCLFLHALPAPVVPSSVHATFVEKIRKCKEGDDTIKFRVEAVLMHLDSVQHQILMVLIKLLAQWSPENCAAAIKRISPVLLGGWSKDCDDLTAQQHLLHLLVLYNDELQWGVVN